MWDRFRRRKPVRAYALRGRVRTARRRRGQSVVEFALVLPIFLALLLTAVDFGRLFFTYIQVSNVAREAAAYGATQPTHSIGMQARAVQESNSRSGNYAGGTGANGWYHIIGFAGFQLTACEGGKNISGVWRKQFFLGPTTGSSPGAFASLAVQLVR